MQWWRVSVVTIYVVKSWKRRHDMSVLLQYPWQSTAKEEKKVQPNLYAMHAKHVIIIPKEIQLTHNTHGKFLIAHPKMNYWAWLWMMTIQQMKPSSSLLKMTSSLLMRLKDKSKGEKKTTAQGWILCILSEKEDEIPARNELIDVTTKSWTWLDEIGGHCHTPPFAMMKK